MTDAVGHEEAPRPGHATAAEAASESWHRLLVRVAMVAGVDAAPARVATVAQWTSDAGRPWSARFIDACGHLGLRATALRSPVGAIAANIGPEHPAVAFVASTGEWLLLTDARRRSVLVETEDEPKPRWMSRGQLAARLDPDGLGSVEWVAVDPAGLFGPAGSASAPSRVVSPLARLRSVLVQERYDVAVVLVYATGVGLLTLATPITVQALVNTVAFGTILQPVVILALLLLAGLSFGAVLSAMQAWVVEIIQRRLFLRVIGDLAHRLPRVDLRAFDRAYGPEVLNRVFDVFSVQKAAASLLLGGVEIVLTAVVGLLVLAFYHPLLLAFDVVLVTLVVVIVVVLGRGATATAIAESKSKYAAVAWLEEIARHPIAFRLAGGPALARERTEHCAIEYLEARRAHYRVVFRQLASALALQALASAGVLGIGGWLVIERQLTLGQLVAAELIVTAVVASLAKVGKHLETYYDLLAALDKVGEVMDLPLEQPGFGSPMPASAPDGAALRVRNLSFGFEDDVPLFTGVALDVRPGERVALRGEGGGGRSALVDVLAGLREPQCGSVEVDGVDMRDVNVRDLHARAAIVRGPEIVSGTLFDNVAFGRSEVSAAAVREALRAVDLLDDVGSWSDGLHSRLSANGTPLSRGQALRVTIARAIVGRPSLLVIDRALDALNPSTRARVLETLLDRRASWTLIVCTDDERIAARCDRVLTLRDGQLADEEES